MTESFIWSVEQTKKEGILAEASKAFSQYGFRKASVDLIARAAGVAKGTVYLACENKQDLFYQVLHREVRAWVGETAIGIDPRRPADEILERLSRLGVESLDRRPLLKTLLFGEAYRLLPAWKGQLDKLVALGRSNVEEVLRLGIEQGIFEGDIDVEETAQTLNDMQLAYLLLHDRPDAKDRIEKIRRRRKAALNMILNGLRVRPAQP